MAERTGHSSPNAPSSSDDPAPCTVCGRAVETSEWHPVVMEQGEEESKIRVFCSVACRDRWAADGDVGWE